MTQDAADPQKIHIRNTKEIREDQTMYVRFMTDFTNVPVGYTVSNTVGGNTTKTKKVSSRISITSKKVWDDRNNADGLRPERVTLQLMNGTETVGDPVSVSAESGWSHQWTDLPEYSADGGKIVYSVVETGDIPGYETSGPGTEGNHYTITNREKMKEETVPGDKPETVPKPAQIQLTAVKTVDGAKPDEGEIFRFELLDEGGKVLQTKKNGADGTILFDKISYGSEDLGATYYYTIRESAGEDERYIYDTTEYQVTVRVAGTLQPDGAVLADVTYSAAGTKKPASASDPTKVQNAAEEDGGKAVFNNRVRKIPEVPGEGEHPENPDDSIDDTGKLPGTGGDENTPGGGKIVTDQQKQTEKLQTASSVAANGPAFRRSGSGGAVKTGDRAPAEALAMTLILAGSLMMILILKKQNR